MSYRVPMDDALVHVVMHSLFDTIERRIDDELWDHIATNVCAGPGPPIRWDLKDSIIAIQNGIRVHKP